MKKLSAILILLFQALLSSAVEVSHPAGVYDAPFQLTLLAEQSTDEIHYTLDGTLPTLEKPVYTSPLSISQYTLRTPELSLFITSPRWEAPSFTQTAAVIIRFQAFRDGVALGKPQSASYFISPNFKAQYPVDILSIITSPENLFSDSIGMHVIGNNEVDNYYYSTEDWERPIHVELINNSGVLEWSQNLGARIHGRSSRSNPQKSMRLYARDDYGSPFIFHPIFGEEQGDAFKRLILKSNDMLFSRALFVDNVAHDLVSNLAFESMASRVVAVFINGEYWGIQSIRERLDEHHLRIQFGIDPDEVDIIDWDRAPVVSEGSINEFNTLMNFIKTSDLSTPEGLIALEQRIDMTSFIDFVSANIILANEDFPNNNCRMWREQGIGNKWRFFLFDCDACLRDFDQNSLELFTTSKNDGNPVSTLLSALMNNTEFKSRLAIALNNHLYNTFSPENILQLTNDYQALYAPLIPNQIGRWNYPENMNEWYIAVNQIKEFAIQRQEFVSEMIAKELVKPFITYPIPAKDFVNLKFDDTIDPEMIEITMYNTAGVVVATEHEILLDNIHHINILHGSPGVLMMHTRVGNTSYFDKVLIVE
jgi:hypothetical protein